MGIGCDKNGSFRARVECRDGRERVVRYKCRCESCSGKREVAAAVALPERAEVLTAPKAARPPMRPEPTAVSDPVGEEILAAVLGYLGIQREYVSSRHKSAVAVRARHVAICLLRACRHPECPTLSFRRIGWLLGIDATTARLRWVEQGRKGAISPWDYPMVSEVAPELLEGVYGH